MNLFKILWNPNNRYVYTKRTIYSNPIPRCSKCNQLIKNQLIYDFSIMLNKDEPISDLISSLYSIHIISHKAYEIFKTEGVRGFKAHKIHILDCDGNIVDTTYYSLQYTGLISINYDEMGITCKKCNVCGMEYIVNQEFTYETLCFDETTWDGSDICVGGYCTSKVVDIVKENELTGFMFKPAEDSWNSLKKSEIII